MSEVIREPGIRVVTKKTLPSNSKHITNGTLPMLDVLKGGRREDKVHATIGERHSGGISANDVSIRVTKPRYFHPIGVDVRKDRHFRLEVFAKTRQRPSLTAADFKNPRRSAVQIGLCRTNELPFPPRCSGADRSNLAPDAPAIWLANQKDSAWFESSCADAPEALLNQIGFLPPYEDLFCRAASSFPMRVARLV